MAEKVFPTKNRPSSSSGLRPNTNIPFPSNYTYKLEKLDSPSPPLISQNPFEPLNYLSAVNTPTIENTYPKLPSSSKEKTPPPSAFEIAQRYSTKERTTPSASGSQYINKSTELLFAITNEEKHVAPSLIAASYFPTRFKYLPLHPYKSVEYYEQILHDMASAKIVHHMDRNGSEIAYSKLVILNIVPQSAWGHNPNTLKSLSIPINSLKTFSYWDYIDAWEKVLCIQNAQESHSWFFKFSKEMSTPNWFRLWWSQYDVHPSILPEYLSEKIQNMKQVDEDSNLLKFCIDFQIPWIMKWEFSLGKMNNLRVQKDFEK